MGQLHWIAQQAHRTADELLVPESPYRRGGELTWLETRVRELTSLVAYATAAAADAELSVGNGRDPSADLARSRVAVLTGAVGALTAALAHLGAAVTHAGHLHQLRSQPRSAERTAEQRTARSAIAEAVDAARRNLNESGGRLRRTADRAFVASLAPVAPTPASEPTAPRSPRPAPRSSAPAVRPGTPLPAIPPRRPAR
ncbi:hypothetical protein VSR01_28125 [Actinacidiphila sp. DG2A-62]|uniref:hypothetical protein n=1 Tax=Actinacidiphila sp. DG2A-62 TaxID=3108821 RepID=UPI002DB6BAFF|nr:hypothetical protein [Actinacidiphila sp. DG2A-62]MEC3997160.1 hypothetical protein [Actinacidiphila sp. DG2A-62]